uniref:Uncharacterized protein n=1 Tax=Rhizophora mucronata TaxID=61149 RepID=A0A2P2IHH6_RHIMU
MIYCSVDRNKQFNPRRLFSILQKLTIETCR